MNYFEIGSVSYFTNVPKGHYPTDEEAEAVAESIVEAFDAQLKKSEFSNELVILGAEVRIGCIITTIAIGATITGIHRFIKNYPSFRPGLLLLIQDVGALIARMSWKKRKTSLYRDDIANQAELTAITENAEKKIIKPVSPGKRVAKRTTTHQASDSSPEVGP